MTQENNTIITPSRRDFILMVIGQIISLFGAAILRFALSLYVLDTTGSRSLFATLFAISSIPLLLAPLGGALADRFSRRNLMVIFDFTSSSVVFCLILLMGTGNNSIIMIGTIMAVLAAISALYTPAVIASVPLLVSKKKLESANGIVQAVQALSHTIAPILGGVLSGIFGFRLLIYISCSAFFLSAVMEIFIKIPFTKREQKEHMAKTIMKDMKEGFVYVVKERFIFKTMVIAAALNFILTPIIIIGAPIILRMTMHGSDAMVGLGMGIIEVATIIGALTVGIFTKKLSMAKFYLWSLLIALITIPMALSVTPMILKMGFYPSFILFILCSVLITAMATILSIFVITKIQKKTPDENMGKVLAIVLAAAQCAAPAGQFLYGILFEMFSKSIYIPILILTLGMLMVTAVSKRVLREEDDE